MRSFAASVLGLLVVGLTPVSGFGQALPRVTDPIFGLSYDSARIRFEDAGDVVSRCPELANPRWGRRLWVFARSEETTGTYMVVGGLYERQEPPAQRAARYQTDPNGVLLREHDRKCELIGPAREAFEYPVDVTTATLQALARDAVRRYAAAFGGHARFLAMLARHKKRADLANPRSAILRDAIRQGGR